MIIKLLTTYASPEKTIFKDQIADVDTKEAKNLIDGGFAIAIDLFEEEKKEILSEVETVKVETADKKIFGKKR